MSSVTLVLKIVAVTWRTLGPKTFTNVDRQEAKKCCFFFVVVVIVVLYVLRQ